MNTKTPPPVTGQVPNITNSSPLHLPQQMHPGMAPNIPPQMANMMPVNFGNHNMQMPMMGQMMMMMPPQMGMRPQPFMMQPPLNPQNINMPSTNLQNISHSPVKEEIKKIEDPQTLENDK